MEGKVEIVKSGITFGTALAMAISFNVNHSVFWAGIHGLPVRFRLLGA